jgi:hypothetical protein
MIDTHLDKLLQTSPASIRVLPRDRKITWESYSMPEFGGSLWMKPDQQGLKAAHFVCKHLFETPKGEHLGFGHFSDVYAADEMALKVFERRRAWDDAHEASTLLANIAMNHGLKRQAVAESEKPSSRCSHPSAIISAPEMYAAFVPEDIQQFVDSGAQAVWAMSRENGQVPHESQLAIDEQSRHIHYKKALARVGVNARDINFDDAPTNMLFHEDGTTGLQHIVKLDVSYRS